MKILLASAPVINREQEFNLQTILEYMKTYRGRAELIVFGEAVLQGFDCLCWNYEEDQAVAAALTDAPIVKLRAAAKTYHLAVSFGMIERRDGSLYSAQLFIGAAGRNEGVERRRGFMACLVRLHPRGMERGRQTGIRPASRSMRQKRAFGQSLLRRFPKPGERCRGLRPFSGRSHRSGASLRKAGSPARLPLTLFFPYHDLEMLAKAAACRKRFSKIA